MLKGMTIMLEVSPGDLVDRLTILEIKKDRINDAIKLRSICCELEQLATAYQENMPDTRCIDRHISSLAKHNKTLWDLEENIRLLDANSDYGEDFISTARQICATNDLRAAVKKEINLTLGAKFTDEKSFTAVGRGL